MTKANETPRTSSGPKEELSAHFGRAITTVRSYTNQFESEVARPAVGTFFKLFEERPILAIFLGILTALSIFPILTFVTASGVTLASFLTFALVTSLSAAFAVIIGFLSILISTLVVSVFVAAIVTHICVSVYLTFRLFALVRYKGVSEGFSCWIGEISNHFRATLHGVPFPDHAYPEVVQYRQPSEQSTEDNDHDRKVEGPPS
jgi:hypothetical protein